MENSDGFSVRLAVWRPIAVIWAIWLPIFVLINVLSAQPFTLFLTFVLLSLTVPLLVNGMYFRVTDNSLFLLLPQNPPGKNTATQEPKLLRNLPRGSIRAVRRTGEKQVVVELDGAPTYRGPAWLYFLRSRRRSLLLPVSADDADRICRLLSSKRNPIPPSPKKGASEMEYSNRLPMPESSLTERSLHRGVLPDELFVLRITSVPLLLVFFLSLAVLAVLAYHTFLGDVHPAWFIAAVFLFDPLLILALTGFEYVFCYDRVELRLCVLSPKRRPARGESVKRPPALRRLPRYRVRKVHTNGRHMYALELEGGKPGKARKFWAHVLANPGRMVLLQVPRANNATVTRLLRAYASGMNLRPENAENAKGFAF